MALTKTTYAMIDGAPANVLDFGADPTGVANSTPAIVMAFAASDKVIFPDGVYLMNAGVTKLANNVEVDFGNATIINGGASFLFTFGATADTPTYTGLKIYGGNFEQSNPATTSNQNYIRIAATENFSIRNLNVKNVSNGGIYVEAGCENGVIDNVTVDGMSGYSTNRGIWLDGSTASDYVDQLVDITSITRNSTPVPIYAVKNVKITNCTVVLPYYGVYLMNARNCHIENNYIDITGSGARCVAVNNYSPATTIVNNTFIGDQSSTGVIVTQVSSDVILSNNTFKGTFGGGRDIYVAFLADAVISNNIFSTDTTQQIQIDMGGNACIRNNYFTRPGGYSAGARCVRIDTIDITVAGTGTYGNTATVLPGLVFDGNIVKIRNCPVLANTPTSQSGNIPGLDVLTVTNNVFYNMNTATTVDEYGLRIYANGSTYLVKYAYGRNIVYPENYAIKNRPNIAGSGFFEVRNEQQFALFRITNPAGGGAVTVDKIFGGYFSCAASRSANDIIISPRTVAGSAGADVAIPVAVTDALGNTYTYKMAISGSNYIISLLDNTGSQIALSAIAATIDVMVTHSTT